jgi:hypothetical protein
LEQLEGPLTALRQGDPELVGRTILATLGVFSFTGDPRWTYSLPNRPLFDPLTAILFYGGLGLAFWRWRRPVYAVLPIWLLVALLPSALSPDAPSTVRLIGALPVVYLLPGLVVEEASRRLVTGRADRTAPQLTLLVLALVGLLSLNAYRTTRDGFVHWPRALETRLRYQSTLSDIARHWQTTSEGAPVVAEAFYEPIDSDSLRRSVGGPSLARWIQTGAGVGGALVWPGGSATELYVPEYAPLNPDLMKAAGIQSQPLYRSAASPAFAVHTLPDAPVMPLQTADVGFGAPPILALRGHALLNVPDPNPAEIRLLTWWEVLADLPDDLALFVHLVDASGVIVAQSDGLDAAAATLHAGDRFLQRHVLGAPPSASGPLTLLVGVYRRGDGQRLPAGDATTFLLWRCDWTGSKYDCRLPDGR